MAFMACGQLYLQQVEDGLGRGAALLVDLAAANPEVLAEDCLALAGGEARARGALLGHTQGRRAGRGACRARAGGPWGCAAAGRRARGALRRTAAPAADGRQSHRHRSAPRPPFNATRPAPKRYTNSLRWSLAWRRVGSSHAAWRKPQRGKVRTPGIQVPRRRPALARRAPRSRGNSISSRHAFGYTRCPLTAVGPLRAQQQRTRPE